MDEILKQGGAVGACAAGAAALGKYVKDDKAREPFGLFYFGSAASAVSEPAQPPPPPASEASAGGGPRARAAPTPAPLSRRRGRPRSSPVLGSPARSESRLAFRCAAGKDNPLPSRKELKQNNCQIIVGAESKDCSSYVAGGMIYLIEKNWKPPAAPSAAAAAAAAKPKAE